MGTTQVHVVLDDYFYLNEPYTKYRSVDQLKNVLINSNDLRDVMFLPRTLTLKDLGEDLDLFTDKTFTNVSFSKTDISGVSFTRCTFIDCLFINTKIDDCEFHRCNFDGCNPFRIEINSTYIDPRVFEGMINKSKHANVGIHLFQQLYDNAVKTNQPNFARTAEFNMRQWERHILSYRYSDRSKFNLRRLESGYRISFCITLSVTVFARGFGLFGPPSYAHFR